MKFWMTNVDFYGERERREKNREKVIDDTSHINNNTRRPSRRRCLHHCESCCLDPRCNNPDFSTFFFAIYWKYLGKFFFWYTGSTKISTKISAESPLYWWVPSYRHIPYLHF
jgi:hypothetical protein